MSDRAQAKPSFSAVCVERCGGVCCDPWWGIISYQVVRQGSAASFSAFKAEVLKGIRERVKRITDAYRTAEEPSRPLFGQPDRYNVLVRAVRASGPALTVDLLAMFAFRCRFLSDDKACAIHPSQLGREIRPPQCGWLGSPEALAGERGYCRVIDAAGGGDESAVLKAVELERHTTARSLSEGVATDEEAAEAVVARVRSWCEANAPGLLPQERPVGEPGRNDPCWCGSGSKFKKCHGR